MYFSGTKRSGAPDTSTHGWVGPTYRHSVFCEPHPEAALGGTVHSRATLVKIAIVSPRQFAQNRPMPELEQILADIKASETSIATRRDWNPSYQGEIDIRIAADGHWYHQGRRFQRDSLVKLFAGILRREQDDYFLVTPAEKLRIEVEDAPFVATLVEQIEDKGQQALVFTTNIGERVVVDSDHPIRVEIDAKSGEPRPYVHLHDGLEALISRRAFFDLANLAEERERDGAGYLFVTSLDQSFELGPTDE